MIQPRQFTAHVILAQKDLATAGGPADLQLAMDAVEGAIAPMPDVAGIEIVYLGSRQPAGQRIRVSLNGGDEAADAGGLRARDLERHIGHATGRVLAGLADHAARQAA